MTTALKKKLQSVIILFWPFSKNASKTLEKLTVYFPLSYFVVDLSHLNRVLFCPKVSDHA